MDYPHWAKLGGGVELLGAAAKGQEMASQHVYLSKMQSLMKIVSVCDLGCAAGHWLKAALDLQINNIAGYDITEMPSNERVFPVENFHYADLSDPDFQPVQKYSLAISTEVAEHLPYDCALNFIRNLTRCSDVVLFGAAIPYQGGVGHQNENWMEYWNLLFKELDYQCFDIFRTELWNDVRVHFYYRQNTVLFVKKGAEQFLTERKLYPTENPLSIIHPEMLIQAVNRALPEKQRTMNIDTQHYYNVVETAGLMQLPEQQQLYGKEDFWFENIQFKRS